MDRISGISKCFENAKGVTRWPSTGGCVIDVIKAALGSVINVLGIQHHIATEPEVTRLQNLPPWAPNTAPQEARGTLFAIERHGFLGTEARIGRAYNDDITVSHAFDAGARSIQAAVTKNVVARSRAVVEAGGRGHVYRVARQPPVTKLQYLLIHRPDVAVHRRVAVSRCA